MVVGWIVQHRPHPQSSAEVRKTWNACLGDDHVPVTLDNRRWRSRAGVGDASYVNHVTQAQLRVERGAQRAGRAEHQHIRHVAAIKAVKFNPSGKENDVQAVAGSLLGHDMTVNAPVCHRVLAPRLESAQIVDSAEQHAMCAGIIVRLDRFCRDA